MKILIISDSKYGNTYKVAKAIAAGFAHPHRVRCLKLSDANIDDVLEAEVVIVGSPTHGGRGTEALEQFLSELAPASLTHHQVAAFDTRFAENDLNLALRLLVKTIGFAAPKIARQLTNKGGQLLAPAEGFIVKDKTGPLKTGELERATAWAQSLFN